MTGEEAWALACFIAATAVFAWMLWDTIKEGW